MSNSIPTALRARFAGGRRFANIVQLLLLLALGIKQRLERGEPGFLGGTVRKEKIEGACCLQIPKAEISYHVAGQRGQT